MNELIIVGAGGLGREVLQYALDTFSSNSTIRIKGFLDDNVSELSNFHDKLAYEIIGNTDSYKVQEKDRFLLAVGNPNTRKMLVEKLEQRGAEFISLVHPKAYVSPSAKLGKGVIISPFATIATHSVLSDHVVLGFYAHVGHDAVIGSYGVLSPYAAVNGGTVLEELGFLGTHAVVTPNRKVGRDAQIAAGAIVYSDVPANRLALGNPAKFGPKLSALSSKSD
ncbi:MAG: acetyltransferase [Trueperaceae bacterium]|nr:acetyltransferase [Trueperaceae bacterium]